MAISLSQQLTRRKPIALATDPDHPEHHHAGPELKRTIGTFALTMFGVGATVGTGIFFVLQALLEQAGRAQTDAVEGLRAAGTAPEGLTTQGWG